MADAAVPALMTFEDFLRGEAEGERRHEWVGGAVYAMAGGTERHDVAVNVLVDVLRPGARRAGCRTFAGNRLVRTDTAAYYPDLFVVCGTAAHILYETDATLITEVRSATTASRDRREKALVYASLISLGQYLLVDPDRRQIEVGVRQGRFFAWETYGPGTVIDTVYGPLVVDEFYDAIDAEAATPPPIE